MVCFQPSSLLIGKGLGTSDALLCVCCKHCKVHLRVGMWLGSCSLTSVHPLIRLTIRAFSIGSALWVLDVFVFSILTHIL